MTSATATAPGRVNLIGEHTDYNGGRCLPFAIPLATTATVTVRDEPGLVVESSADADGSGTEYVAGVVWALREAGWDVPGLDVAVTTDLPLGGGLSSSAALECAVAVAVAGLLGRPLDRSGRRSIAEACRRAETEHVGAPTGGMDQLASMLGTADGALLLDFADPARPRVRDVPLPLAAAGLTVLVTDTGVRHVLADGDGGYAQRRRECAAGDPRRLRHVTTEDARVGAAVEAIEARDWGTLGVLMTASHTSLREDFEVSVPELDTAVDAALAAGALGARLTGGGFGGCTIALVAEATAPAIATAVDDAYAAAGWPAPTHRTVRPAAGARLLS
ncbi:galactokinase [Pimelobacter simplex]|uniref:Galactokinase n=1 Tax=Nocardioides simplex TaxID=2045 RepID=A0A0A1DLM7_NOCSI|nr:galactokinase family protein [Pimelobacter simplex]AIY17453.1 Galactokinase [Pimelobacter simplex]MCG8149808.1 galactokinase [Pimelobacter simplex]GEB13984.1 galactokinase [Pimelobacter simplex]SFM65575.1 galactokinase [Pimelobacter simplex]